MQLFVSFMGGKTVIVESAPDDTIRVVLEKAYLKLTSNVNLALPSNDRLKVIENNKRINNLGVKPQDLNLQNNATLRVEIGPATDSVVDQGVLAKLQAFMRTAAGELGSGEITFIGVGSFDNGHGDESIKRQQCPDALIAYCMKNRVDLNIILVDPGFAATRGASRQIYDFPGWGLLAQDNDGKIRQYSYGPAVAAKACDVWLTVFATGILEYGLALTGQGKTVGGIHVPTTFAVVNKSEDGSCVICGNFYGDPTDPSQYFTLGSQDVIKAAGFVHNP